MEMTISTKIAKESLYMQSMYEIFQQYVCVLIEWDVNQKCLWWQKKMSKF